MAWVTSYGVSSVSQEGRNGWLFLELAVSVESEAEELAARLAYRWTSSSCRRLPRRWARCGTAWTIRHLLK